MPRFNWNAQRARALPSTLPALTAVLIVGDYEHLPFVSVILAALLLLSLLLTRRSGPAAKVSWIDGAVLLVAGLEVPSLMLSHYRPNGWDRTLGLLFAAAVYLIFRQIVRSRVQLVAASSIVAGFGVWLSVGALTIFGHRLDSLHIAGFEGIVPFREMLTGRSGYVGGEWFTLVLLTFPFALLLAVVAFSAGRRWLGALTLIPAAVIALELTTTCSRAVFFALVAGLMSLTCVSVLYGLIPWRRGLTLLVTSLAVLGLILLIGNTMFPGVGSCYIGHSESSQARSAEGRLSIWHSAIEATRGSRVWGVGSGNSGFLLSSNADESADSAFAARTFSLPVEILVEKGIVGICCYALLILAILFELHRTLRSSTVDHRSGWIALVAFTGIVMGLFRDLTYSSLMAHPVTLSLFFALIGILSAAKEMKPAEPATGKPRRRNKR